MLKKFKDVKVEITVNGGGFDNPSDIMIEDDGEIPFCNMMFPGGIRSRYKIKKSDLVRVYLGLDELPDYPSFTGYQTSESGLRSTTMEFAGGLFRATRDYKKILDTDNYDGLEIGNAILNVLDSVSGLSWLTPRIQQTNPAVYIPADTIRYEKGISKYDLMKEFRDIAVDPLDAFHLGRYAFFIHGDIFYFRSVPDPKTAPAWLKIAYGDTLLDVNQEGSSSYVTNKITVIGDEGIKGDFQNDHRIEVDELLESPPINDNSIASNGQAYEIARSKVLAEMIPEVPLMISSPLLLEGIPNATVLELTGAPYGLSDNYLLKSKSISVGENMFEVSGTVSTPVDAVSEAIAQILGLNRDLPLTASPTGSQLV